MSSWAIVAGLAIGGFIGLVLGGEGVPLYVGAFIGGLVGTIITSRREDSYGDIHNQADNLVHSVRKMLVDAADKITDQERHAIEQATSELEESVKEDGKDRIKVGVQKLTEATPEWWRG